MDNYRGFEDEAGLSAAEDEPAIERPPEIGVDERRMHVRAYNYWVSLLAGRAYPAIQDVDPTNIEDFGPHSVLLDFSRDPEDPVFLSLVHVGRDALLARHPELAGDADGARVLRSVLMKPEHELAVDWLHERVEGLARDALA